VAALPIGFTITSVAVSVDAGAGAASAMALSAAAHVPAQLAFAVVFASVLARRGPVAGAGAGVLAYVGGSLAVAPLPAAAAVALALPALVVAPRLIPARRPRPGSPRPWPVVAMLCAASAVVVGLAVLTSRLADPATAGAVAAFPTVTSTLALAVVVGDGVSAGAHVLAGLTRSLPCYLTFCLVVVAVEPRVGVPATAVALAACLVTGRLAWRGVPVAATALR
jgi:hypothetical protein